MNHEPDHLHDPENDIAHVFTALRDAQPGPGMEQRILARLHQYDPAPRWSFARLLVPVCAALAICIAFALHHRNVTQTPNKLEAETSPHKAASNPASTPAIQLATGNSKLETRSHRFPAHRHAVLIDATTSEAARTTPPLCDCDPTALAETQAPSRPAPPLPLTPQEQMMLQILHRGDTEELAQLDPEARARKFASDKAQFKHFFAPTTSGDKE